MLVYSFVFGCFRILLKTILMRKTILSILGLVIIALSFFLAKNIIDSNQRQRPKPQKIIKTVFVDTVQNGNVPIVVSANGSLTAKRRMELYSEVQGVLQPSGKLFKPGQTFRKGEVLLRMDGSEFYASLQSQRSNLYNQIAAIMPDIRLDYPESFDAWQAYLSNFSIDKGLAPLPEAKSEKEKYFINGRNISSSYYSIKNLEQRYSKFSLRAPFEGILTEALVTEGTLVRAGQKLGEFIDTGVYELPVAVNKSFADMLAVGKKVALTNLEGTRTYEGTVSRINGNVDVTSQTIDAFIEVTNPELREGMYLEAQLDAKEETEAYRLERNLLQPNDQLFVVRDSLLDLIDVRPVYFEDKTVVVKEIPNGSVILKKALPGAYAGMLVKVFGQEETTAEENKGSSE